MDISREKRILILVMIIGGILVIGSYVHGLSTHPSTRNFLWGDIPHWLMPFYTFNMLLAAAGYFLYTWFFLFRVDSEISLIYYRFSYWGVIWLYAMVLFPSALWMPLTFAFLDNGSAGLWIAVRVVLLLAGLGSLGLMGAVVTVRPAAGNVSRAAAFVGAVFFSIQTVFLDAIIWPAFFPVNF